MKCIPAGLSSWGFGRHMVEKATEGLFLMKIKDGEDKRGGKDKQEQQGAKLWYSHSHCTEKTQKWI